MATIEDRGMTGRDVIAKTFTAKARRGYEPVEVDSYLEQVGNQIDALRAEIARLELQLADAQASAATASSLTPPPPVVEAAPPAPVAAPQAAPAPTESAASVETADIVLRMAHETSARAIEEAQGRADEILSDAEFKAAEERGFTAVKHQREVGAGYFDRIATTVDPNTSTAALKGSTEEGQFH